MSQISNLIIDSHQHFWKYDPVKYSWIGEEMAKIRRDFLPNDLQPVLERNDVDGTVLVQADQSENETVFLLELAEKSAFVKGVVGWVDLSGDDVEERLLHFKKNSLFKGVRHTVYDKHGEFMLEPAFQRGIAALGKLELTYDLLVFDYQLPGAIELVQNFPKQQFVLDHMAKPQISAKGPSERWKNDIQELAASENVFCKISGMFTEAPDLQWERFDFTPYLDVVAKAFGPERLMFGSDWPVSLSAATYEDVLRFIRTYFTSWSAADLQKVMGENAVRFYGLEKE